MAEIMKSGMDPNGIVLLVGVVVLVLLVLLRNRPFIYAARLFSRLARPLGRMLKVVRLAPRGVGKQARNYVGPSAFSAFIRAFRWKTETDLELEKTEFVSRIVQAATEKAKRLAREGEAVDIEEAGRIFHEDYKKLREYVDAAVEEADGDIEVARQIFLRTIETGAGPEGVTFNLDSITNALAHERGHLKRRGGIFNWLVPQEGFIRTEHFEFRDARDNYFLASLFFTYDIPVQSRATNLYEDIDGAVSVSMFGTKDRDIYFLFTEMRKVINGNVRKLTLWFSALVAAFFLLNVYVVGPVPEWLAKLLAFNDTGSLLGIEMPKRTIFIILSAVISLVVMWLLYYAQYTHYTRNNARELNNFLTRYLAMLHSNYNKAIANARGVFAGEMETREADVEEHAVVWFANIQWIAFRAFHIEKFLRNTMFQIHRNSGYYVILIPIFFALVVVLLLFYSGYFGVVGQIFVWRNLADVASQQTAIFAAALVVLILMVIVHLAGCLKDLDGSIRESEWFNFHDFGLQKTTTNLIGRYGGEILFWRHRLKTGEGRGA